MLEINVNVTVHAPEISALLERMTSTPARKPYAASRVAPESLDAPKGVSAPTENETSVAPPEARDTHSTAYPHPDTVTPTVTVPVATVSPVAPVSTIPTYSLEQVAKAGADLMTSKPEIQGELFALLSKYSVRSVQDIPADKLGAFATELRKLGGKL